MRNLKSRYLKFVAFSGTSGAVLAFISSVFGLADTFATMTFTVTIAFLPYGAHKGNRC